MAESHGNNDNTGNGYYGYFQFLESTWLSLGMTGYPHYFSLWIQYQAAQRLQIRSGWGQWSTAKGCGV